jgi:hypothetical protein
MEVSAMNVGSVGASASVGGLPPEVPPAAVALNVGQAALREVLAGGGTSDEDRTATAIELLRNVEALLRSNAPNGISSADIGRAAARLVERQGLLEKLGPAQRLLPPVTAAWPTDEDGLSPSVDTRL